MTIGQWCEPERELGTLLQAYKQVDVSPIGSPLPKGSYLLLKSLERGFLVGGGPTISERSLFVQTRKVITSGNLVLRGSEYKPLSSRSSQKM